MTGVCIREELPEAGPAGGHGTQLGGETQEGIPGQGNRSPCKGAEEGKHAESGSQTCVAGWSGWSLGAQVAGVGQQTPAGCTLPAAEDARLLTGQGCDTTELPGSEEEPGRWGDGRASDGSPPCPAGFLPPRMGHKRGRELLSEAASVSGSLCDFKSVSVFLRALVSNV